MRTQAPRNPPFAPHHTPNLEAEEAVGLRLGLHSDRAEEGGEGAGRGSRRRMAVAALALAVALALALASESASRPPRDDGQAAAEGSSQDGPVLERREERARDQIRQEGRGILPQLFPHTIR